MALLCLKYHDEKEKCNKMLLNLFKENLGPQILALVPALVISRQTWILLPEFLFVLTLLVYMGWNGKRASTDVKLQPLHFLIAGGCAENVLRLNFDVIAW